MLNKDTIKYLGDIINSSGNIDDTIEDRKCRAAGIITQTSSLLSSISLGWYYFQIALLLHESMFINSILISSETWYFISKKNMEIIESCDAQFMRKILNSYAKTVRELYYLELGKLKLNHIISKRRLLLLHHILTRKNDELIKKVYLIQKLKPTDGDFYLIIRKLLKKYDLNYTDDEISQMKKNKFKPFGQQTSK